MKYVNITMSDGTKHQIWTTILDIRASNPAKKADHMPTLVLTHGYGGASCHFVLLVRELMRQYRVVMFDNLSFGGNPRDGECKV